MTTPPAHPMDYAETTSEWPEALVAEARTLATREALLAFCRRTDAAMQPSHWLLAAEQAPIELVTETPVIEGMAVMHRRALVILYARTAHGSPERERVVTRAVDDAVASRGRTMVSDSAKRVVLAGAVDQTIRPGTKDYTRLVTILNRKPTGDRQPAQELACDALLRITTLQPYVLKRIAETQRGFALRTIKHAEATPAVWTAAALETILSPDTVHALLAHPHASGDASVRAAMRAQTASVMNRGNVADGVGRFLADTAAPPVPSLTLALVLAPAVVRRHLATHPEWAREVPDTELADLFTDANPEVREVALFVSGLSQSPRRRTR